MSRTILRGTSAMFSSTMAATMASGLRSQQFFWQRLLLVSRSRLAKADASTETGLGLLECLVAIAVIAISVAVILPPLFISAGSRVQNRRAEQAFQVAQAEVDRIQALVAQAGHTQDLLPGVVSFASGADRVPPPTGGLSTVVKSVNGNCNRNYPPTTAQIPTNRVIAVDVDGTDNCAPDFYVQIFRDAGTVATGEPASGRLTDFILGVRVYSVLANDRPGGWAGMTAPANTQPASLNITSGQGNQFDRPLVTLYPRILWTDNSSTLCDFHRDAGRTGCT